MLETFMNKRARVELIDGSVLIGEITNILDEGKIVEIECDLIMFEPVFVAFRNIEKIIAEDKR